MIREAGKHKIGIYKISDSINFDSLESHIETKGYHKQEVRDDRIEEFSIFLYYASTHGKISWKKFISSIAKSGQDILRHNTSLTESFVLLLKKESAIYAVTGGLGYFIIESYLNEDFGMGIFARIIKKDEKIIKAVKERSFVGGILGESKHFRNSYNLHENDDFGKIYQELKADINKSLLTNKLGFQEDELRKNTVCIAKASFTISKAITFEQLLKVIRGCENILVSEEPISINNVIRLDKKIHNGLIRVLNDKLLHQLWERFSDISRGYLFDLCNKEFEKYLIASRYEIRRNQSSKNIFEGDDMVILNDIEILFQKFKDSQLIDTAQGNAKENFISLIKSLKIYSFDDEGKELTQGWLMEHILGDVEHEGTHYFFIDNSWYKIKDNFIESLNQSCNIFIKNNWYTGLQKTWNFTSNESEDSFNKKHINDDNTVVLHKITVENIEPCDILKWDTDNLYFIHIKSGFGNTMRDLCAQMLIAARRIIQDLNSDKSYVNSIYTALQNKIDGDAYFDAIGRQTEHHTNGNFMTLFDKKPIFVLAVLDTGQTNRDLRNAQNFKSNIAKFSLQDLVRSMKGLDMNLMITQINRS